MKVASHFLPLKPTESVETRRQQCPFFFEILKDKNWKRDATFGIFASLLYLCSDFRNNNTHRRGNKCAEEQIAVNEAEIHKPKEE